MNTTYNVNLIKADKFETLAQKQGSPKPQDIDKIVFNTPIEEVSKFFRQFAFRISNFVSSIAAFQHDVS